MSSSSDQLAETIAAIRAGDAGGARTPPRLAHGSRAATAVGATTPPPSSALAAAADNADADEACGSSSSSSNSSRYSGGASASARRRRAPARYPIEVLLDGDMVEAAAGAALPAALSFEARLEAERAAQAAHAAHTAGRQSQGEDDVSARLRALADARALVAEAEAALAASPPSAAEEPLPPAREQAAQADDEADDDDARGALSSPPLQLATAAAAASKAVVAAAAAAAAVPLPLPSSPPAPAVGGGASAAAAQMGARHGAIAIAGLGARLGLGLATAGSPARGGGGDSVAPPSPWRHASAQIVQEQPGTPLELARHPDWKSNVQRMFGNDGGGGGGGGGGGCDSTMARRASASATPSRLGANSASRWVAPGSSGSSTDGHEFSPPLAAPADDAAEEEPAPAPRRRPSLVDHAADIGAIEQQLLAIQRQRNTEEARLGVGFSLRAWQAVALPKVRALAAEIARLRATGTG